MHDFPRRTPTAFHVVHFASEICVPGTVSFTRYQKGHAMSLPTYEIHAIKYAWRDAKRHNHFVGGDPHDAPMPMDYFVWLVRNEERTVVIDTGFNQPMADKRNRVFIRQPADGLALLGVKAPDVKDIILTHLHYDHVGTFDDYPNAQFHIQDDEMSYATGRHMRHKQFNHGYEVDEVIGMVRLVYKERVTFYNGDADFAPGISIHRIGGHTKGLQSVRVHTKRGWVMVASDASHYYEHFEKGRVFTTTFQDRKSTRLNSSHVSESRMPSSA